MKLKSETRPLRRRNVKMRFPDGSVGDIVVEESEVKIGPIQVLVEKPKVVVPYHGQPRRANRKKQGAKVLVIPKGA